MNTKHLYTYDPDTDDPPPTRLTLEQLADITAPLTAVLGVMLTEMKWLACDAPGGKDYEATHLDADVLLQRLLDTIAARAEKIGSVTIGESHAEQIRDIVKAYQNVGKWYA
jgi:hypothetical protein